MIFVNQEILSNNSGCDDNWAGWCRGEKGVLNQNRLHFFGKRPIVELISFNLFKFDVFQLPVHYFAFSQVNFEGENMNCKAKFFLNHK